MSAFLSFQQSGLSMNEHIGKPFISDAFCIRGVNAREQVTP